LVVDTSVLLSVLFDEPHGAWAAEQLNSHAGLLRMSTVNLTETFIHLRDRQPTVYPEMERQLFDSGIDFVPPTADHARIAAEARLRFPLNLGDCFAYALAVTDDSPILTLDTDFRATDCALVMPDRKPDS
jgi:ribonuclease VapC